MSVVYLESEEVKGELQQLRSILKRCYGPLGKYVTALHFAMRLPMA